MDTFGNAVRIMEGLDKEFTKSLNRCLRLLSLKEKILLVLYKEHKLFNSPSMTKLETGDDAE
jgi:hypothetical protein